MIDAVELAAIIREQVGKATAPLLIEIATLKAIVGSAPVPRDGKDADPMIMREMVIAEVLRTVDQIPRAKDGIDGKDGAPGAAGKDGLDGAAGRDGIDGAAGKDGVRGHHGDKGIDGRDGIDGKDGAPGLQGKDGATGAPGEDGREGRDGQPGVPGREGEKGLDGLSGKDGVDGFTLDDISAEIKDGNTVVMRLKAGEREKSIELRFPTLVDCGVYKDADFYQAGSAVTYGGSLWLAQVDTRGTPGKSADWRLAVRRGKDGKDASDASSR